MQSPRIIFTARVLSLVVLVMLVCVLSRYTLQWISYGTFLSHSSLALLYGDYSLRSLGRRSLIPVAMLATASILTGLTGNPLIAMVVFGAHHALTEVYLRSSSNIVPSTQLGFAFHFLAYLFVIRTHLTWLIPYDNLIFAATGALLAWRIISTKTRSISEFFAAHNGELLIFIVVTASWLRWTGGIRFHHTLMYHFLLWYIFPLLKSFHKTGFALKFSVLSGVTLVAFCALVFQIPFSEENGIWLLKIVGIFGYFHVGISLYTSKLNPWFIQKLMGRTPTTGGIA